FGEQVSLAMPEAGHDWHPTRQPMVLAEWRPDTPRREVFTTVMNWSAKHRPLVYEGQSYGQKDEEFLHYLDLPGSAAPTILELAMNAGKDKRAPHGVLNGNGWRVVDPEKVCRDLDSYRR